MLKKVFPGLAGWLRAEQVPMCAQLSISFLALEENAVKTSISSVPPPPQCWQGALADIGKPKNTQKSPFWNCWSMSPPIPGTPGLTEQGG